MPVIEARSEVSGSVWKILKKPGDAVSADEEIIIVESMKMEIPVIAEDAGTVREILVREGQPVAEGQVVALLESE